MSIFLVTLIVALLAYAQGRSTLPLFVGKHPEGSACRLLLELLLGNAWMSVEGLLLAELGAFSSARMVGLALLVSAIGLVARRWRRGHTPLAYGAGDVAGVVILIAAYLWATPAFDTSLFGADSSVYLASGMHIASYGGIAFHDPALAHLDLGQKALLFPSYIRGSHAPPFLRIPGGLLMPSLRGDLVLPAFHHLFSVWVALFYGLGGDAALTGAITYFAALSFWAVVVFASELAGTGAAWLAGAMLMLLVPQYWYSRFPMPEVPSQYFLWAGLVVGAWSLRSPRTWLGALAGLGVGIGCLMRFDNLAHVVAGLALWKAFGPRSSWPGGRGFATAFAAVAAYAVMHQILFPTHYLIEVFRQLRGALLLANLHPAVWFVAALAALGLVGIGSRRGTARQRWADLGLRLLAFGCFAAYAAASFLAPVTSLSTQLDWIVKYLTWPLLAATAAGAILWFQRAESAAEGFPLVLALLVSANLIFDPRVAPAALWGIRRFVPIVLPAAVVAAALALERIRQRAPRPIALALIAAVLAVLLPRFAATYTERAYNDSIAHARAIGAVVRPGAVVVGDPSIFVPSQLHMALWATCDADPFVLSSRMVQPLRTLRRAMPARRMFWIGPVDQAPANLEGLRFEPVATYRFSLGTRRMESFDERDDFSIRQITLGIYEVH